MACEISTWDHEGGGLWCEVTRVCPGTRWSSTGCSPRETWRGTAAAVCPSSLEGNPSASTPAASAPTCPTGSGRSATFQSVRETAPGQVRRKEQSRIITWRALNTSPLINGPKLLHKIGCKQGILKPKERHKTIITTVRFVNYSQLNTFIINTRQNI